MTALRWKRLIARFRGESRVPSGDVRDYKRFDPQQRQHYYNDPLLVLARYRGGSSGLPPYRDYHQHRQYNDHQQQQPPPPYGSEYPGEEEQQQPPPEFPDDDDDYLDDIPPPPDTQRQPPPSYRGGPPGGGNYMMPPPPLPPQEGMPPPPFPMDDPYSTNPYGNEPVESLQQQQPYPDDAQDWDGETSSSPAMDLSAFDKEFILKGLARLYRKKILPLELSSKYGHFHSPPLSPSDFDAPPLILLLGQYSVGKTSFIKYLLGRDFPGIRVGPEPTTDRFTAILWGQQDKVVPGAALCSQSDRPFTGLSPFGNNFLSRMEGAELDAPILRNVTLIDTPGILSGQKQRSRNYDYEGVMKWFAERADLIIIMFDAHKVSWMSV